MLGNLYNTDLFRYIPRLKFQAETPKGPLFRLDWAPIDSFKLNEYISWVEGWATKDLDTSSGGKATTIFGKLKEGQDLPHSLPPELDWVADLYFVLPHNYRTEIEHFTLLFALERTKERKFDTCVRDRCLETSAAAINTAFYLLCDCLYDPAIKNWRHGSIRRIAELLLRYKFWRGFTGSGLVWDKSGLTEYEAQLNDPTLGFKSGKEHLIVINDLRQWEKTQEQFLFQPVADEPTDLQTLLDNGEENIEILPDGKIQVK